jgi:hypothetical protein
MRIPQNRWSRGQPRAETMEPRPAVATEPELDRFPILLDPRLFRGPGGVLASIGARSDRREKRPGRVALVRAPSALDVGGRSRRRLRAEVDATFYKEAVRPALLAIGESRER